MIFFAACNQQRPACGAFSIHSRFRVWIERGKCCLEERTPRSRNSKAIIYFSRFLFIYSIGKAILELVEGELDRFREIERIAKHRKRCPEC